MIRSPGESLLLSAIGTLPTTSPEIVNAVTLSLPLHDGSELAALRKLALALAEEHGLHADVTVQDDRLVVRLARRRPTA
jgi:hypothetical protein